MSSDYLDLPKRSLSQAQADIEARRKSHPTGATSGEPSDSPRLGSPAPEGDGMSVAFDGPQRDGLGPRIIDQPKPGWFLVQRLYADGEVMPRFLKDREYVTASIREESQPDDATILLGEIDGRPVDPMALWNLRLWPVSEAEYEDRRRITANA